MNITDISYTIGSYRGQQNTVHHMSFALLWKHSMYLTSKYLLMIPTKEQLLSIYHGLQNTAYDSSIASLWEYPTYNKQTLRMII
jgi:hypothetical protein